MDVSCHFQKYFRYTVAVSDISGGNQKNHWSTTSTLQILSHIDVIEYTSPHAEIELTPLVVIDTDYIGRCKSNYHIITSTTVSLW